jgi:hypothetical protein
MLLQSQELASLVHNNTNNLNNLKNSEVINVSKKFTEERSKSDSISMGDGNVSTLFLSRMKPWKAKLKM